MQTLYLWLLSENSTWCILLSMRYNISPPRAYPSPQHPHSPISARPHRRQIRPLRILAGCRPRTYL
ncbi:hypothetical protein FIBSPDRAFT_854129, partial [Athelia psychrophila]